MCRGEHLRGFIKKYHGSPLYRHIIHEYEYCIDKPPYQEYTTNITGTYNKKP